MSDMERAERQAKRAFARNHYRVTSPPCCATCGNSIAGAPEESRECKLAYVGGWSFNTVDELGLCDEYVKEAT